MIDPTRQELLRQVERLSEVAPEFRFGQLVANLAFVAAGPWNETLWDVEDEQLLSAAQKLFADLTRRESPAA